MAKRRKLEAPSTEILGQIEEEFRRETSIRPGVAQGRVVAPIAQVAADTAQQAQTATPEIRAEQARNKSDAERLHQAVAQGLVMAELPVDEIDENAIVRDRAILDEGEMTELRQSIATSGLRLPIEVFEYPKATENGAHYGLLSGYRRLKAVRALLALSGEARYGTIKALVRPTTETDDAFVAMVEENEIRSELSQYERGRVAVIAAQHGAFVNVEEAVNRLFASASRAKRSKVRSFALVFEELGDMLAFPERLSERQGLRLAQVLRNGGEPILRNALANNAPADADEEWRYLEAAIEEIDSGPRVVRRGGRPRTGVSRIGWQDAEAVETSSGITIRHLQDSKGLVMRFEGGQLDREKMAGLVEKIRHLLEGQP